MNCRPHALMLTLALTGLAVTAHAQAPGPAVTETAAAKTPLAFVTNNPSDYWTICRKGTEAAAKELGSVLVQFVRPADGTAATQKRDVDDLLAHGVQGVAICPVDPQNETSYLNSVAEKTNLITSDSDAAQSERLCYIGTDNHAAGFQAGQLIKAALPHGGQIMLFVGYRSARNAQERERGIQDALRGSRIHIIAVREDDADHARARQNSADALVSYPHIAALVGLWSYNGPAILSAVQDAGKIGKVNIVCFDEEQDTLTGVKSGAIYATVVQQPYQFGYQSVKLLAQLARGNRSAIPPSKRIIVPTLAIKRGNVSAYVKSQEKLLAGS